MKSSVISALLIDDEPDALFVLSTLIKRYCPQINIVGEVASVEDGLSFIQRQEPDLVFLDIDLERGNGFEILDAFPQGHFKVVFVTGHDDFALQAFKYRALHYLLKPVSPQDLIQLAHELVAVKNTENQPVSTASSHRISLPTLNGTVLLDTEEIMYFESNERYSVVLLSNGEKIFISRSLKSILESVSPQHFMQVHQSYIVRIGAVRKIQKTADTLTLILKDKSAIPVSRRMRSEVLRRFDSEG